MSENNEKKTTVQTVCSSAMKDCKVHEKLGRT